MQYESIIIIIMKCLKPIKTSRMKIRSFHNHYNIYCVVTSDPCAVPSPVIVSITECSNRDCKRLPNRVQVVLDHLSLVADGEPGSTKRQLNMMGKTTLKTILFVEKIQVDGSWSGQEICQSGLISTSCRK